MYEDDSGRRNASGYGDPTYHRASRRIGSEGRENIRRCERVMLAVATAMGCDVTGRLPLRDRKTGERSG